MYVGKLFIDPLAIAALVGFGSLILITLGLTIWLIRQIRQERGRTLSSGNLH